MRDLYICYFFKLWKKPVLDRNQVITGYTSVEFYLKNKENNRCDALVYLVMIEIWLLLDKKKNSSLKYAPTYYYKTWYTIYKKIIVLPSIQTEITNTLKKIVIDSFVRNWFICFANMGHQLQLKIHHPMFV